MSDVDPLILDELDKLASPRAAAPLDPEISDAINDFHNRQEAEGLGVAHSGSPAPFTPGSPSNYNFWTELGNGLTLGGGSHVYAASRALKMTLGGRNWDQKSDFGTAYRKNYLDSLATFDAERRQFSKEHPTEQLGADILGGSATTGAALGLGSAGVVAPAAGWLTRAAPEARPLVNLLSGTVEHGAGLARNTAARIIGGAEAGATAGGLQSQLSDQPLSESVRTGAEVGGVLNPMLSPIFESLLGSHITPQVAGQADALAQRGVVPAPGSLPGAPPVIRSAYNLFGDTSGEAPRAALTRAAGAAFGEQADQLTPEVFEAAQRRLGAAYDQFNDSTINKYPDMLNAINDITAEAHNDVGGGGSGISEQALERLRDAVGLIHDTGSPTSGEALGTMSGKSWRNLVKPGSSLDRLALDPEVGHYAGRIRDVLHEMLARSEFDAHGAWRPAASAAPAQASGLPFPTPTTQAIEGHPATPTWTDSQGAVHPVGDTGAGQAQVPAVAPLSGETFTPQAPAPGPNMEYVIDPATQGALQRLRDTNAQWKNMNIVRGAVDPTTGIVQPSKLSARISRGYPPSSVRQRTRWEDYITALAPGKNFIPDAAGKAPRQGALGHALELGGAFTVPAAAAAAVGGLEGMEGLEAMMHNPIPWLAALALGYSAKAGIRAGARGLNSPGVTRGLIDNAFSGPYGIGAGGVSNMLFTPPATQLYNGGQ